MKRVFPWVRPPFLLALATAVGVVFFYQFGRPLWYPVKARLTGERTVRQVLEEMEPDLKARLPVLGDWLGRSELAILAFKEEERLELWRRENGTWQQLIQWPFTGSSGVLGPKLAEGDLQIPEGLYEVESLNPNSLYHLSLKVSYPNAFDREMARKDGRSQLGGDIFIHGSSVTIGCIPIGDSAIEELFYLVARNGRGAQVIIAPRDVRAGEALPDLPEIDWEQDLYREIAQQLQAFVKNRGSS